MKVIPQVVTQEEIGQLLQYMEVQDDRVDQRPDVRSKHPRWDQDPWPQHILARALAPWLHQRRVEEVVFNDSRISFRLHADSGDGNQLCLGEAMLIPLWSDGPAHTVFFDNYWTGASTRFSRANASPFQYEFPNSRGELVQVQDIRDLLDQCRHSPQSVRDFAVSADFVRDLAELVDKRSGQGLSKADARTSDYSLIENYDADHEIEPIIRTQYLGHIDRDSLRGLRIDSIVEWKPGDVMIWPRQQIHCAASGHLRKIGVTVFTQRV